MFQMDEMKRLKSLLPQGPEGMRRQDLPPTYILNGAIYFGLIEEFKRHNKLLPSNLIGYELDRIHAIDIDTLQDFNTAEKLVSCIK